MNESKLSPSLFLSNLEMVLYLGMEKQTSACLFGSSMTNDWIAGRSDLDLFVIVPEKKLELFGNKIKEWHSNPANPLLDGYVLYASANGTMVKEFHKFEKTRLVRDFIPLIDLWNVKNRSKHLFGQDVTQFVREISREELKAWAFWNIENHWIPLINDIVSRSTVSSEIQIPLSTLIFMASGVARILMLTKGNICSSKREALQWLANEYFEIRETINLLQAEFEKPNNVAHTLTASQAVKLGDFYLKLLRDMRQLSQQPSSTFNT
jgi:hypothetical protein